MNKITEIVYDFIADDEEAMPVFAAALEAIAEGLEGEYLGKLIRERFADLIATDESLMPLIRRMYENVDWPDVGRRLAETTTAT